MTVFLLFGSACGDQGANSSGDAGPPIDGNVDHDAFVDDDASMNSCAPMDAHEGADTCDGGGAGYKWNGETCVYQGDLCNCVGSQCDGRFDMRTACLEAFAECVAA